MIQNKLQYHIHQSFEKQVTNIFIYKEEEVYLQYT